MGALTVSVGRNSSKHALGLGGNQPVIHGALEHPLRVCLRRSEHFLARVSLQLEEAGIIHGENTASSKRNYIPMWADPLDHGEGQCGEVKDGRTKRGLQAPRYDVIFLLIRKVCPDPEGWQAVYMVPWAACCEPGAVR